MKEETVKEETVKEETVMVVISLVQWSTRHSTSSCVAMAASGGRGTPCHLLPGREVIIIVLQGQEQQLVMR